MRQKRNRFPRWKIVGSMLKLAAKAFIIYSFVAGLICWYYPSNTNIQQLTRLQYKLNKADPETWRMYYSSLFLDYQQKEVRAIPYIANPISVFRSLYVKEVDPDVVHIVKTSMRYHKKHLFEINLTKLDISSTKDTEQDFSYSDFHGSNLEQANMQGTILVEANFLQSNLRGANLEGSNMTGADLRGTNLTDANLEGANLKDIKVDHNTRSNNPVIHELIKHNYNDNKQAREQDENN